MDRKRGGILLTGWQPPVVLEGRGGALGKAGVLVACAALASAAVASVTPLAPFVAVAGGGLALISERLLEIPIVLVGLAWVLLDYSLLVVKGASTVAPVRLR